MGSSGALESVSTSSPGLAVRECEGDERVGGRVVSHDRLAGVQLLLDLERQLLPEFHTAKMLMHNDVDAK